MIVIVACFCTYLLPCIPFTASSGPPSSLSYLYCVFDRVAVVMVERREVARACFSRLLEIAHKFCCLKLWIISACKELI